MLRAGVGGPGSECAGAFITQRDQIELRGGGEASHSRGGERLRCSDHRESRPAVRRSGLPPFLRRFQWPSRAGLAFARSGVVVDASGLVVTNNHVIENADQIKVALADKREFDAVLVLKDERSDLAVLRITDGRERFTAVDFGDSDALEVGDLVLAVGNPFGIGQTVTHGIVSAVARTQVGITDYQFFIQTDAAINPGNSGGALFDIGGRLVGINTAIFSRSGGSQGIGFAIPANMVRAVVASAKAGAASVRRPWLGAELQAVTPEIAESLSLKRPAGALVNTISPRSPAARSGLRTGDLIVEVDGQPIDDPNAFDYRFATKPLGGQAQVAVMRGGREVKIGIPLETAPETPREEIVIKVRSPLLGARVANLSPAVAEELRLDYSTEGVVVTDVENGSASQSFGFQKGDIVVSVNNARIAIMEDLLRAISQPARLWRLTILRGGREISAVFGG